MKEQALPTLYGKASSGKIKIWNIKAVQEENGVFVETTHGYEDGAQQTARKEVKRAKSAATVFDQAVFDAQSKWNKKHDENYRESVEEIDTSSNLLPMLAQKYVERKHKVRWPAYAQPKLNGVRCLSKRTGNSAVEYTSRKAKTFHTMDYLTPYIRNMVPVGTILDGELFNPNLSLQQINSRARRALGPRTDIEHDPLQYWVYDAVFPEESFNTRFDILKDCFADLVEFTSQSDPTFQLEDLPIVLVNTVLVNNEQEFEHFHGLCVQQGFEGAMLRNLEGEYRLDYRSPDLLKYKHFTDEEFPIVGGHEGEGKDAGTVVFECITQHGKVFSVRPKGTWETRHKWWLELESLKGKLLTVRYQDLSDDGVPTILSGIDIRDYE